MKNTELLEQITNGVDYDVEQANFEVDVESYIDNLHSNLQD